MDSLKTSILLYVHTCMCIIHFSSASGPLCLNVTTVEDLEFEKSIESITTGPYGNLIITALNAVWNVNIEVDPPTKNIIAGQSPYWDINTTKSGYREGTGTLARFSTLTDVVLMSSTRILVTDNGNSCLRTVNLRTNTTSTYAGRCLYRGHVDGYRLRAKFTSPYGMFKLNNRIYVTDYSYGYGIRVLTYNYIHTLFYPHKMLHSRRITGNANYLYITSFIGIARVALGQTLNFTYMSGSMGPGGYANTKGIALLDKDTLLVTNLNTDRLQIIDLQTKEVSLICSGSRKSKDGDQDSCSLLSPTSVHIYEDKILIGESVNGSDYLISSQSKLRTLPLCSVIEKPSDRIDETNQDSNLDYVSFLGLIPLIVIIGVVLSISLKRRKNRLNEENTISTAIDEELPDQQHDETTPEPNNETNEEHQLNERTNILPTYYQYSKTTSSSMPPSYYSLFGKQQNI